MSCALFISSIEDHGRFGGYQGIVKNSRDPEVIRHLREVLSGMSLGMDTEDASNLQIFFINTQEKGIKDWERLYGNAYSVEWVTSPGELVAKLTHRTALFDKDNKQITQTVDFSGSYSLARNAWGDPLSYFEYVADGESNSVTESYQSILSKVWIISWECSDIAGRGLATAAIDLSDLHKTEYSTFIKQITPGTRIRRIIKDEKEDHVQLLDVIKVEERQPGLHAMIHFQVLEQVSIPRPITFIQFPAIWRGAEKSGHV